MTMKQLELFPETEKITLEEIFEAYYECRRHKRRTANALMFELNLEANLVQLWRDINDGTYEIGRSIAFVVRRPVLREIFAADFRDRIVHHLIIRKLMPLFERVFSPHSYSCRVGKGTLCAAKATVDFMKRCSKNYTSDCYVMRLDIQSFFMSINQRILFRMLKRFILKYYGCADKNIILKLTKMVVFNRPQKGCVIKGGRDSWNGLPRHKSLFYVPPKTGIPIGNLTSQVFANFYLNALDLMMDAVPGLYYGRYVDDLVLIHPDKNVLCALRYQIDSFLRQRLALRLHPLKCSVQHYAKGFSFVGWFFRPHRVSACHRLKGAFWGRVFALNQLKRNRDGLLSDWALGHIRAVMNSYFGLLRHFQTWRLRLRGWNFLEARVRALFITNNRLYLVRYRG